MIIFKKIRWQNLLSYGNSWTEVELNSSTTTLIIGKNGAGKSTILDALFFALFGKPFRKGLNKPQLLNTITKKALLVELEFKIGKKEYLIRRGIKPNVFEVYQNNKLLNQSADSKDYQNTLEQQILKTNHKSCAQIVALGSSKFTAFMDLTTGQRREIIEDLLDLQMFSTMNSVLKSKVQNNDEALADCIREQKSCSDKIELYNNHLKQIQSKNELFVEDKKQRIQETEEQIKKYLDNATIIQDKIKGLNEFIKEEESLTKKMKRLTSIKHQLEGKLNSLEKEVSFFNDNDICPSCKQPITEDHKHQAVVNKNNEKLSTTSGLAVLVTQYEELDQNIDAILEVKQRITSHRIELNQYITKMKSLENYKNELEEEITKAIASEDTTNTTNQLEEAIKKRNELDKTYNESSEEREILYAAGVLLKDGGIKAKIIKQYIPIINKLINKYLAAMDFYVQFELDEQFSETIKSRYMDEFTYSSFSEGEKMRINIAILFAWRAVARIRNSINTNILIMDEVLDSSLDDDGTEEFLKIIKQLTTENNTFIISHKVDQLSEKFDRVIRFNKYKSFSRIED